MNSVLWSWLLQLIAGGLTEATIRYWAEKIAVMLGLNPKNFADFILFLSRLPAEDQKQAEAFLAFAPAFGAPNTPPGATDAGGQHEPDLPENCNEFAAQFYQLRGKLMESSYEEEAFFLELEEKPKKGKKPAAETK